MATMKTVFSWITGLWQAGRSLMGIRTTPEPRHDVLSRDDRFEIRAYPPLWVAQTVVTADYRDAGRIAFNRLASYIFGGNTTRQGLPMTTPVFREAAGECIAMTAPVLQQPDGKTWTMSFVMPEAYDQDTLPIPLDANVVLKQLPARKVAVLCYSGALDEKAIARHSEELLAWLARQSLKPLSPPRSAAYDPPWTLPMRRRNEIHADIG